MGERVIDGARSEFDDVDQVQIQQMADQRPVRLVAMCDKIVNGYGARAAGEPLGGVLRPVSHITVRVRHYIRLDGVGGVEKLMQAPPLRRTRHGSRPRRSLVNCRKPFGRCCRVE